MSPKRLDHVAPPGVEGVWYVRSGTSAAAKGWTDLCAQFAASTCEAFEQMRASPRPPQDSTHYQLRGSLACRDLRGRTLEQWQIKVSSSSSRIWYRPDDEDRTVWVVYASAAHPKQTD